MNANKAAKATAKPRRRGWRIPHSMPKGPAEAARLREEIGPRAYHKPVSEWPRLSEEERERLNNEFKEPTPGEIRAFRLRHGLPRDWTVIPAPDSWVVESPRWERTRPTPCSQYVRVIRVYSLSQEYFDEFHSECMEVGASGLNSSPQRTQCSGAATHNHKETTE